MPNVKPSWEGHNFDFTAATFDGGSFAGVNFSSGKVIFDGAAFPEGRVSFRDAKFSGAAVTFRDARLSGSEVDFKGAAFSRGKLDFTRALFEQGRVDFRGAKFSGGTLDFDNAKFSAGVTLDFTTWATSGFIRETTFSGGILALDKAAEFMATLKGLDAKQGGVKMPPGHSTKRGTEVSAQQVQGLSSESVRPGDSSRDGRARSFRLGLVTLSVARRTEPGKEG